MSNGFESKNTATTLTITQLRNMAATRLQSAERRLAPGAAAAFNRAGSAQDSMIGSLLFSLLIWTPVMHALNHGVSQLFGHSDGMDMLCNPLTEAFMEASSMLRDEKAYANRSRKVGIYHGGRRQDEIVSPFNKKLGKSFNFVSANENSRFSMDANTEVAAMSEIIDMLDRMEKDGVTMVRIDAGVAATEVIKAVDNKSIFNPAKARFASALRRAA